MITGFLLGVGAAIVVLGVGAVIWFASNQAKAWRASLQHVAETFGLSYQPGGTFTQPKCVGSVGPLDVIVDTYTVNTGKSSSTYTRVRVRGAAAPMLTLRAEGMISALGKAFVGDDIQLGDPEFDDRVVVRGEPDLRVLSRMDVAARSAITAAVGAGARFAEGEWTLSTGGLVTDAARLENMVSVTLRAAQALARTDVPVSEGLRSLLDDPSEHIRIRAAGALGGPAALEVLSPLLTHPTASIRRAAAVALAHTDGPYPSDLESQLLDGLADPDAALLSALERTGTVAAVPPLRALAGGRIKLGATARQATQAIRAIQARIVGAEAGTLAVADTSPGQLSEAEDALQRARRDRASRQRES